jgi:hypothetical protein
MDNFTIANKVDAVQGVWVGPEPDGSASKVQKRVYLIG